MRSTRLSSRKPDPEDTTVRFGLKNSFPSGGCLGVDGGTAKLNSVQYIFSQWTEKGGSDQYARELK